MAATRKRYIIRKKERTKEREEGKTAERIMLRSFVPLFLFLGVENKNTKFSLVKCRRLVHAEIALVVSCFVGLAPRKVR